VRPVVVVTKVVGEAGEQFITSREVRISDAIDQVVDGRPREASDTYQILKGTEKTFPAQVTKVLDEWVIVLEAKALSTSPPQKTEVARITKQVQERWGSVKDWVELEVSADEVREAIERKLTARELERLKANPQAEPTSDEEAQAYYNKNRLKFGQLTFAET
jgi:uncharacterized protein YhdP